MIKLQTDYFEIDLSLYGVSLKEKSSLFNDDITESYSLPFVIPESSGIIKKLGLPTLENIVNNKTVIPSRIVMPERHFKSMLFIDKMKNKNLSCRITFGDNMPEVFNQDLKDLPWPNILTQDLAFMAKNMKDLSWPEVKYNFPMVYTPHIKEESNYERFEGYVNNFDFQNEVYLENEIVQEPDPDSETGEMIDVIVNRNVMKPFVYLCEILTFGYNLAGKKVIGDFINHPKIKKIVFKPENCLEKFDNSQYQNIVFSTREGVSNPNFIAGYNLYEAYFTPSDVGTYKLKLNFNFPPGLAQDFKLQVFKGDDLEKEYISVNSRVDINESIELNIEDLILTYQIVVRLYIPFTNENISEYNNIEFEFTDGKLNVFPNVFSLKDFMPDMTFGDYVNFLKNWFNLDIQPFDNFVKIDFVKESVLKKRKRDHEHLQIEDYEKEFKSNRFYKFSYANDERIFFEKQGQVYSDIDNAGKEIISMEIPAKPLIIEINNSLITAYDDNEASDFDFVYYDGGVRVNENPFSLQAVFDEFWRFWMRIRVNAKLFKETIKCSIYEEIYTDELSKKYNELLMLKEVNKKYNSDKTMEVSIEAETL